MKREKIRFLYDNINEYADKEITIGGWIKTIRDSKALGFIELNDGSSFKNLQIVFENDKIDNFAEVAKYSVGSAVTIVGTVVVTPQSKQPFELHASKITLLGAANSDYPLQKKKHSLEFLRTIPHLRSRTNTFGAAFRVRSVTAYAIHKFFNDRGFVYVHTPIVTSNDCEGAGEMFRVTTLDMQNPPKTENGNIDYSQDFFGKETSLTVSGQLQAESMAMAFGDVYTFGPTFRAENSNTPRHVAEFWMIEPEIAFADLNDDMNLAEDMIKFVLKEVMENCPDEMQFFNNFYDKGLIEKLNKIVNDDFAHITYTQAIEILEKNNDAFEFKAYWGCDLQTEHERYITEKIYNKPVFVTDYPKDIKAFYMRMNDDNKTVAAMDLLVPGVGELIGGSQREERLDYLLKRMEEMDLDANEYSWYLDSRRYGTVEHAGFGVGFERLIMYITGISNIRDVLPSPRTVKNIQF